MKSIIEIDDKWYEEDFCDLYKNGREILDYNQLPNPDKPFDTIYNQQHKEDTLPIDYDVAAQIASVYRSLNDKEKAKVIANLTEEDWRAYQVTGVINGYLIVPPERVDERVSVSEDQRAQIGQLYNLLPDKEDPEPAVRDVLREIQDILNEPADTEPVPSGGSGSGGAVTGWFWSPRGEVLFAVGEDALEIPTWPESVKDSIGVAWSQEMTTNNHYEPVNTYKNSGPRVVSCTFKLHRAMWTGDESDDCEQLVALMESACYPDYEKQSAEPPECCLIIGNSIQIVGIMTSFEKTYQGPVSEAVKYDEVIVSISITEVSQNVLSTQAVRGGLAGVR